MLDVHCNTVPGEGRRKEQGLNVHWHVNIQADDIGSGSSVSLPDHLGISLGHKTEIAILGSKQRLNLQGQHESLAGEGRLPVDPHEGQPSQRAQGPPSLLWTDRPWPRTPPAQGRGAGRRQRDTASLWSRPPLLILPQPLSQFAY